MKKNVIFLILLCSIGVSANPLYTKCIPCHGAQGEKVALGKSLVIKDMKKEVPMTKP